MHHIAPEVVSIADASLGGLQGRSALVIGPEELCLPYVNLLRHARMKYIYQEETPARASYLLPYVQLLISVHGPSLPATGERRAPLLSAATIAKGCDGRRTPLLIFDLAPFPSVEELAGLLPEVCLYTPDDLRRILTKLEVKAS
jgi:hypothetical protein